MKTPRPNLLCACIAATLFVAAPQAFAQQDSSKVDDQAASQDSPSKTSGSTIKQLDAVKVTARGISEVLQETPLPITAVTDKIIEAKGLTDVRDIAALTPSFSFRSGYGRGFDRPVIRGMSNIQGEPNASFFIDGVFVEGDISSYGLENIQRVEIIRGPQSAAFGRRTFSGAVNFITHRPGALKGGKVTVGAGNYGQEKIQLFYSNGNDNGTFGYDFSLVKRGNDSIYFNQASGKRDLGGTDTQSAMGSVFWAPTDNLEITARLSQQKNRDEHFGIALLGTNNMNCYLPKYTGAKVPGAGFPILSSRARGYYCGDVPSPKTYALNTAEFKAAGFMPGRKTDFKRSSVVVDYNFDNGWKFTSTSAYNETSVYQGFDQDYSPKRGFGGAFESIGLTNSSDWSQDFRISTDPSRAVSGLAGVYYFHQRAHPGLAGDLAGFVLPGNFTVKPLATKPNSQTVNKAVYGLLNWEINDAWTASLEGRYAKDEISRGGVDTRALSGVIYSQTYFLSDTFTSFTPRATLSYQAADNINVYGLVSKGTKPGGFNVDIYRADLTEASRDALIARGLKTFEEEKAWNYELGVKSDWLDQTLRVNANVYQINWDNQQLTEGGSAVRKNGSLFSTSYTTNVGESRIRGVELETQWLFAAGWLASLNYSYTDAKILSFIAQTQADLFCPTPVAASTAGACANAAGNILPRVPKTKVAFGLMYDGTLSNGWGWSANTDTVYESRRYVQVDNLASSAPSTRTSFRVSLRPNDALQVSAFVTNAFNDRTPEDVQRTIDPSQFIAMPNVPPLPGLATSNLTDFGVSPSLPRMYGVEVSYRF